MAVGVFVDSVLSMASVLAADVEDFCRMGLLEDMNGDGGRGNRGGGRATY